MEKGNYHFLTKNNFNKKCSVGGWINCGRLMTS